MLNVDRNAQFSLLNYLRLTQFLYTEIGNFPNDSMSERDRQFLYTKVSNFPDDFKSLNKLYEFYTEIGKFPDDSFV